MTDYKQIDDAIAALDIEYSVDFVPQSQSRDPAIECLNWRIKFGTINVQYSQGVGHLPGYVHPRRRTIYVAAILKRACEEGVWDKNAQNYQRSLTIGKVVPPPSVRDVVYSLLMESEVLDYSDFESWADNCGYDTDSRKAEIIYRTCLDTGLKLRSMMGDKKLNTLRELFQDY